MRCLATCHSSAAIDSAIDVVDCCCLNAKVISDIAKNSIFTSNKNCSLIADNNKIMDADKSAVKMDGTIHAQVSGTSNDNAGTVEEVVFDNLRAAVEYLLSPLPMSDIEVNKEELLESDEEIDGMDAEAVRIAEEKRLAKIAKFDTLLASHRATQMELRKRAAIKQQLEAAGYHVGEPGGLSSLNAVEATQIPVADRILESIKSMNRSSECKEHNCIDKIMARNIMLNKAKSAAELSGDGSPKVVGKRRGSPTMADKKSKKKGMYEAAMSHMYANAFNLVESIDLRQTVKNNSVSQRTRSKSVDGEKFTVVVNKKMAKQQEKSARRASVLYGFGENDTVSNPNATRARRSNMKKKKVGDAALGSTVGTASAAHASGSQKEKKNAKKSAKKKSNGKYVLVGQLTQPREHDMVLIDSDNSVDSGTDEDVQSVLSKLSNSARMQYDSDGSLPDDENKKVNNSKKSFTENNKAEVEKKQKKPPPITVTSKVDSKELVDFVKGPPQNCVFGYVMGTDRIKIFPATEVDAGNVRGWLTSGEFEFYTHVRKNKTSQFLLDGLPFFDANQISKELFALGIQPLEVRLIPTKHKHTALFAVDFMAGSITMNDLVDKARYIDRARAVWKISHKKKGPFACKNCAMFGHASSGCHRKPICTWCGEGHAFAACHVANVEGTKSCISCRINGFDDKHEATDLRCNTRLAIIENIIERKNKKKRAKAVANSGAGASSSAAFRNQNDPRTQVNNGASYAEVARNSNGTANQMAGGSARVQSSGSQRKSIVLNQSRKRQRGERVSVEEFTICEDPEQYMQLLNLWIAQNSTDGELFDVNFVLSLAELAAGYLKRCSTREEQMALILVMIKQCLKH